MKRLPPLIDGVFNFMEIWKDVKGYEGLYQVSNLGQVYSPPKDWMSNKVRFTHSGKMLKQANSNGYKRVVMCKDGKRISKDVHQIVAEAFLNHVPCGYKLVVDHINDNKHDNRVENLQVVTVRFNVRKTQGAGTSKYKGVCFFKNYNKWVAKIEINKKTVHLGYFEKEHDAHLAYQDALKNLSKLERYWSV